MAPTVSPARSKPKALPRASSGTEPAKMAFEVGFENPFRTSRVCGSRGQAASHELKQRARSRRP